jgi:hypothetical protein
MIADDVQTLEHFSVREATVRTSVLLVPMLLVAVPFFLQSTVNAQTSYVTVYGQLSYSACTAGSPCVNFFYLVTNSTTPGIPNYLTLDFSQSLVPPPAQSDVGKMIAVTGYYGQESNCQVVNGCPAFFVHIWGPHYGQFSLPTSTGCFSSSNPPTTWYSVQCGTAPTVPLVGNLNSQTILSSSPYVYSAIAIVLVVLLGYLFIRRRK